MRRRYPPLPNPHPRFITDHAARAARPSAGLRGRIPAPCCPNPDTRRGCRAAPSSGAGTWRPAATLDYAVATFSLRVPGIVAKLFAMQRNAAQHPHMVLPSGSNALTGERCNEADKAYQEYRLQQILSTENFLKNFREAIQAKQQEN